MSEPKTAAEVRALAQRFKKTPPVPVVRLPHRTAPVREPESVYNVTPARPRLITRMVVPDVIPGDAPPVPMVKSGTRRIIEEVATAHNMTVELMLSKTRVRPVVHARQEAMYRLRQELKLSMPIIGVRLGFRDHASVYNGIKQYAKRHDLPIPGSDKQTPRDFYGGSR